MTCIVGLQHAGRVWLGGDSASVEGSSLTVRRDTKVFVRDGYALGFACSWRLGQVLRYETELPDPASVRPADLDAFMVTEFVPALRNAMFERQLVDPSSGDIPGSLLVGVRGVLFSIDYDLQTCRARDDYMAIGVGSDLALGALYATKGALPAGRVRLALRAAERHSTGVAAPFKVVAA